LEKNSTQTYIALSIFTEDQDHGNKT